VINLNVLFYFAPTSIERKLMNNQDCSSMIKLLLFNIRSVCQYAQNSTTCHLGQVLHGALKSTNPWEVVTAPSAKIGSKECREHNYPKGVL
jgi:hypothetical protein